MTAVASRSWALDGIEILRSGRGGDGRTVEAYAAVFDTPAEVRDQQGHYMEVIDRTAFDRSLSRGIDGVGAYYHHGFTLEATPSLLGSIPIGSPLLIKPDGKGLLTRTRFNRSPFAESVLEAIRNGDIKGYSFRGDVEPVRPVRRAGEGLPLVRRSAFNLVEYGPTPTPVYADAGIVAVRSVTAVQRRRLHHGLVATGYYSAELRAEFDRRVAAGQVLRTAAGARIDPPLLVADVDSDPTLMALLTGLAEEEAAMMGAGFEIGRRLWQKAEAKKYVAGVLRRCADKEAADLQRQRALLRLRAGIRFREFDRARNGGQA